ncbi:predicted protein [Plenodomus lingam JN3]|uniref:Predicted protein n=1 Tax=Leptosphaeria maculans (strain JN3 / isolate v23.1.3 / race Av1-4-5-6-7-8) TaxID=985895 RepID=E4ZTG3_LEPMJ|nr:predicted protein [Plenodomus lingam JN3]CBX94819.1 predicted protein [Plenodomus lingam JN3]
MNHATLKLLSMQASFHANFEGNRWLGDAYLTHGLDSRASLVPDLIPVVE